MKTIKEFKDWNLGDLDLDDEVKNTMNEFIVKYPNRVIGKESFNDFSSRVLNKTKELIKANKSITASACPLAIKLVSLWNSKDRPEELSKEFRQELVKSEDLDSYDLTEGEITIKFSELEDMEEEKEMEDKEQTKDSDSKNTRIANFIDCILTAAPIVHKMHLRITGNGSYAAHKALDKLYNALPDHADAIAEAYQGYSGTLLSNVSTVDQMEYLEMEPIEYVEYLIKYVDEYRTAFDGISPLQNLIDELQSTLYSTRYKLKFLV